MKVDGHTIEVSHEYKELFSGVTKGDIIQYYRDVAERMLPFLEGRPISMQRFPDGIGEEGFYQKEVPDYFPSWISRVKVKKEGGSQEQVVVDDEATLVYLANQACITPHTWLCSKPCLTKPDKMVFDLDPSQKGFGQVKKVALRVKKILEADGLTPFVMLTGGKGLHVVIPLKAIKGFDAVRAWAREKAEMIVEQDPEHCTVEMRKKNRDGKIFIDYLRNAYAQTSVPPYAVRARKGAPVAMPLEWNELSRMKSANQYTLKNVRRRLAQKEVWKAYFKSAGRI